MPHAIKRPEGWAEVSGQFATNDVNYPVGWLESASTDELAAIGVHEVAETAPPEGHRVIGSQIEDRDGLPVRVLLTEPVPIAEIQQAQRAAIDARAAQAFAAGFAPPHPAFAGERLQVRNNEDRTNWLTSQASYAAAVQAGAGDVVDASFRTAGNATITVSYADGLTILLAMAAWGRGILARSWALKDAIAAGAPIDIDAGWPG